MTVCSITFLNFKINKLVQPRNFPGNLTVIFLKFDSSAPCGFCKHDVRRTTKPLSVGTRVIAPFVFKI